MGGVFDAPAFSYHWGARTLAWVLSPEFPGPPPLPADFPTDNLTTIFLDLVEVLSELGSPSDGPVRFTLVSVSDEFPDSVFEFAPPWPTGSAAADLAIDRDSIIELAMLGERPPVYRAEGQWAEELRLIRTKAQEGDFGNLDFLGYIPIRDPDGSRYLLFVRDVGEIESPEGVPLRDPFAL
ncbi:MAG: hypothetical protein AAGF92_24165 [Myxococcota bacterium]